MNLDQIAAHLEIQQVIYRYCRGVDRGDAEIIRSVYHEGALDHHGEFHGPGSEFADRVAAGVQTNRSSGTHNITNILIELDGDVAAVESYFIAYHPFPTDDGGETLAIFAGRYLDRFERRDRRWLIADRKVVMDWTRMDVPERQHPQMRSFPIGRHAPHDISYELFASVST